MLSPALSGQAGSSAYTSPISYAQYPNSEPSPIEALKAQQRHFHQQLILLQQQQRQLEATAAAVASSPYLNNANPSQSAPGSSSGPSRPLTVTTPGVSAPHSAGSLGSPGYFSPLTSPALDAPVRAYLPQSHGSAGRSRPHPLSALSSPALNPVGSSGGAQQTLSPAFGPQSGHGLADPEYLSSLAGFMDMANQQAYAHQQLQNFNPNNGPYSGANSQIYHSPALSSTSHAHSSPLVHASGPGPNRQSLPSKTRPSPMMKPTNGNGSGNGNGRSGKRDSLGGAFSVPSSPVTSRHHKTTATPSMHSLPPAAIQPRHLSGTPLAGPSTSSTPSPVDLAQMMPPPPVPMPIAMHSKAQPPQAQVLGLGVSGVSPMTPATLMNMGRKDATVPEPNGTNSAPKRGSTSTATSGPNTNNKSASTRKLAAQVPSNGTGAKRGATSRLAVNTAGKRALAMRPPTGVAVRASESFDPSSQRGFLFCSHSHADTIEQMPRLLPRHRSRPKAKPARHPIKPPNRNAATRSKRVSTSYDCSSRQSIPKHSIRNPASPYRVRVRRGYYRNRRLCRTIIPIGAYQKLRC